MFSFAIYLIIWIFAFKLFDIYLKKQEYTDEQIERLCIVGIIVCALIYKHYYTDHWNRYKYTSWLFKNDMESPKAILSYGGHLSNFRESHILPKPLMKPILPTHDMERSVIHPPYNKQTENTSHCDNCCKDACSIDSWKSLFCCCKCFCR